MLFLVVLTPAINAASLENILIIPGGSVDKTLLKSGRGGINVNRLGGFGSDIYYDRKANLFYGLVDRRHG